MGKHILTLLLAACGGEAPKPEAPKAEAPKAEAPAAVDPVQNAASAARAIRSNPAGAEEALKAHGLSAAQFEELMYEIAQDPAKSAAYEKALR